MAEIRLSTDWVDALAFDAQIDPFTVRMDSPIVGQDATGPSPKRLLMAALLGCTGMDVASLLKKMRVPFTALRLEGSAPVSAEHPKTFERVTIRYHITGQDINLAKAEKAIRLSQEKYCAVSAMLRKHCPIDWEIYINDVRQETDAAVEEMVSG